MSEIYTRLRADIVVAMKARDSARATILRTNDAAIQRAAMDANAAINDALVVTTLRKAIKNLTAANEDFAKGGRADLIATNDIEIAVIEGYLPAQIDGAKLEAIVVEVIAAGRDDQARYGQSDGGAQAAGGCRPAGFRGGEQVAASQAGVTLPREGGRAHEFSPRKFFMRAKQPR